MASDADVAEAAVGECASALVPCKAHTSASPTGPGGFFFWTRFKNLAAKQRKINDRVVPILVAIRNWNDVIWLSRSEKVAEFAQCVAP